MLTAVALIVGLVLGFVAADGDSTAPVHDPSGNAIGTHVALGVILVAIAGVVTWRTGSLRWLGAPWSRTTGQRFRYTFAQSRTSPLIVQRAVGAVLMFGVACLVGHAALLQVGAGEEKD